MLLGTQDGGPKAQGVRAPAQGARHRAQNRAAGGDKDLGAARPDDPMSTILLLELAGLALSTTARVIRIFQA